MNLGDFLEKKKGGYQEEEGKEEILFVNGTLKDLKRKKRGRSKSQEGKTCDLKKGK